MYPKPNFDYAQSMSVRFIKIDDILKNPNMLKYVDEKDIKVLKETKQEIDDKQRKELTNKLYDA